MVSGCQSLLKEIKLGFQNLLRCMILDHITSRPLPADNMAEPADVDDSTS